MLWLWIALGVVVLVVLVLVVAGRGADTGRQPSRGSGGEVVLSRELMDKHQAVTAAWTAYGLTRQLWATEKFFQTFPGESRYRPTFEEEVEAREALATLWEAAKKQVHVEDPYLDHLLEVVADGYLREYVWGLLNKPWWGEPDDLRHDDFHEWLMDDRAIPPALTLATIKIDGEDVDYPSVPYPLPEDATPTGGWPTDGDAAASDMAGHGYAEGEPSYSTNTANACVAVWTQGMALFDGNPYQQGLAQVYCHLVRDAVLRELTSEQVSFSEMFEDVVGRLESFPEEARASLYALDRKELAKIVRQSLLALQVQNVDFNELADALASVHEVVLAHANR
jgi:hypothetical protein